MSHLTSMCLASKTRTELEGVEQVSWRTTRSEGGSKRYRHQQTMTSPSSRSSTPLKFSSFTSQVDPSFWFTLSTLKLNTWKLDASPRPTYGIYSTPLRQTPSGDGTVEFNSGAFDESMYFIILDALMIGFLRDTLPREDGLAISTPRKIGGVRGCLLPKHWRITCRPS
jgi:hypothetical protein